MCLVVLAPAYFEKLLIFLECIIGAYVTSAASPAADLFLALFGWAFGFGFWPQKPKAQPKELLLEGVFQKQLLFRSSFLKAGLTLLLAFGFLFFEIGEIKSSSIVVQER